MRVLFLTSTYPRQAGDPTPSFVADLAEHLVLQQGCEVHVVAPGNAETPYEDAINGVYLHRFQYAWPQQRQCLSYGAGMVVNLRKSWRAKCQVPGWMLSMTFKAMYWARQCDLIHAHWVEPGFLGSLVKRQVGCPLVVTAHRIQRDSIGRVVYRATFGASDLILFNSDFTKSVARDLGLRCRGQVMYQGYDSGCFGKVRPDQSWRQRLGIWPKVPMVLALGRMVEWKGFGVLLESWPQVLLQCPQARLVLAGDGPQRSRLFQLAERLGVSDSVSLPGAISKSEVPSLMADADVFCNPGIIGRDGSCETLGIAVIEAMACGLACVGSRVGGIPEIIVDGQTGLLVEPGVPSALAEALISLITQRDIRERMAQTGRGRVRERFSWSNIAGKTFQAYCRVLNSARNNRRSTGSGVCV